MSRGSPLARFVFPLSALISACQVSTSGGHSPDDPDLVDCAEGSDDTVCVTRDCAGVPGGSAFVDACDRCVSGTTGLEACAVDCHGDPGGSAVLDGCGACTGGATGLRPCDEDCAGKPGGSAYVDACGRCVGGTTNLPACEADCHGDVGGQAQVDDCGVCAGGLTGVTPCRFDCAGVPGGAAEVDGCGTCAGGTTGVNPCAFDCNGIDGGSASYDACGQCTGGDTGIEPCAKDCAGIWGGEAFVDACGACVGGTTGSAPCGPDCAGVLGGEAVRDRCGVCSGGTTGVEACVADCAGVYGGDAVLDACNRCVGGSTGRTACGPDCSGELGGSAAVDGCGVCSGGSTGVAPCVRDCQGNWGGSAFRDGCGTCVGGTTGLTACEPGVCEVGGTAHPTVARALANRLCNVIVLPAGRLHERLVVSRTVTIRGAGRSQTTLDGDAAGSVVSVSGARSDVRLEGLAIENGRAEGSGGGIFLQEASLTLREVTIRRNVAEGWGGGIGAWGGTLTLDHSEVSDNLALGGGGAGVAAGDAQVVLRDTTLRDNRLDGAESTVRGAGLNLESGQLRAERARFVGNRIVPGAGASTVSGGGLYLDDSNAELVDCTFEENEVEGKYALGAALRTDGAVALTVRGGSFARNRLHATSGFDQGGIISLAGSGADDRVQFEDVTIEDNVVDSPATSGPWSRGAGGVLGALGWTALDVRLVRVVFSGNRVTLANAGLLGGLVSARGGNGGRANLTVVDSLARDNVLTGDGLRGGLFFAYYAEIRVLGSTATGNVVASTDAASVGGPAGLLAGESGSLWVENSTLHGNRVTGQSRGMSIVANDGYSTAITLRHATVTDNVVEGASGTEQTLEGRITAQHTVFAGNGLEGASFDCAGGPRAAVLLGSYNYVDDAQHCIVTDDATTRFGSDPSLSPLADHGGLTPTRVPESNSPLRDAGSANCASGVDRASDQRGLPRPRGAACDIGSVEVQ